MLSTASIEAALLQGSRRRRLTVAEGGVRVSQPSGDPVARRVIGDAATALDRRAEASDRVRLGRSNAAALVPGTMTLCSPSASKISSATRRALGRSTDIDISHRRPAFLNRAGEL
jgi:hypothetical protein